MTKSSVALQITPFNEVIGLLKQLTPRNYGHSDVRIGGNEDGGYVVPDDLIGIDECFSPGCAGYWHFEKFLESKYGIHSHICDSEDQRPNDLGNNQDFEPYYLGATTENNQITLEDWINRVQLNNNAEFILQIDIEGAEYLALLVVSSELLKRFRIIIIELHHLEGVKNYHAFQLLYKPFFTKLLENFDVTHAHANNCCGNWQYRKVNFPVALELTLHRKDRRLTEGRLKFGLSVLDFPNVPNVPELPINWSLIHKY